MASVIDVKTLSKKEIVLLLKDLIDNKMVTHQILAKVAETNSTVNEHDIDDMSYIESLIDKHFEEYDEVFRKLA
jgi:predicted house-cleaning noncanonical NTP pyrophosphatase (MazG superfamily)